MDTLFDYLRWRGDVPLSLDPFGEVDALLLAELAYADLAGLVPAEGAVPLRAVCAGFFETHSRAELAQRGNSGSKAALQLEEMCAGARFRDTRLCSFVSEIDRERETQFAAVTALLPDGAAFVAFRGTDSTLVGWKEDFHLACLPQTEGQRRAAAYLDAVGAALGHPLRVGGHSKGGNFAVYAASFCASALQARVEAVWSFDGPGFRAETLEAEGYRRMLPRIHSVVPDTAVIGRLLASASVPRVVKSCASGIQQHDGFSWAIRRNRFVEAPPTELGLLLEQALGTWLEHMDDETRESLTDTVFSLLEATGQDSFRAMGEKKWKSAEAVAASMVWLPKEKRQELRKLAGQLLQSCGQSAAAYLPGRSGGGKPGNRE